MRAGCYRPQTTGASAGDDSYIAKAFMPSALFLEPAGSALAEVSVWAGSNLASSASEHLIQMFGLGSSTSFISATGWPQHLQINEFIHSFFRSYPTLTCTT